MQRDIHYDRMRNLVARALDMGAETLAPGLVHWRACGSCEEPDLVELRAIEDFNTIENRWFWAHGKRGPKDVSGGLRFSRLLPPARPEKKLYLRIEVRCRKCKPCREARRRMWAHRALNETRAAARTWFGTLTLRPEDAARYLELARMAAHQRGEDFEALPMNRQFWALCQQVGPEVTKYIKRVRKNSGSPLRVLICAEAHKSNLPHYHALVHEVSADNPVKYKTLTGTWHLGFSKWKLVDDPRMATYVCKYVGKDAATRIRASKGYGSAADQMITAAGRDSATAEKRPLVIGM